MREIEIKARLDDPQTVVAALTAHGATLSEPVTQHDRVFGLPGVSGGANNSEPWLRIRTQTRGGETTHFFTLKMSITGQLDSIEHEVIVNDDPELANIIDQLGFVPYSDLTKTRRTAKLDRIEICVDHIDGLGDFIEGEILTDDNADIEQVTAELWRAFDSLRVDRTAQVTDGYDVLMNKQLGKE